MRRSPIPITFQPPQPVSPDIGAAYGAAQVSQANLQQLSRQYAEQAQLAANQREQNQRIALAAREGDLNRMMAGAQLVRRDEAERAERELQAQRIYQQGTVTPADAFQAQQRQIEQQQNAQNQAWLMQQDLSQKEKMRYERMKNAVAEVESQVGKGLTREEANDYIFQLRTGIDLYEQRQKNQHTRLWQQQADAQAKQAELMTTLNGKTAEEQLKYLKAMIRPLGDGFFAVQNDKGRYDLQYHAPPKPDKPQEADPFDSEKEWKQAYADAMAAAGVPPGLSPDKIREQYPNAWQPLNEQAQLKYQAAKAAHGTGPKSAPGASPPQATTAPVSPPTPEQQAVVKDRLESIAVARRAIAARKDVPAAQKARLEATGVEAQLLAAVPNPTPAQRQRLIELLVELKKWQSGPPATVGPGGIDAFNLPLSS